MTVYNFTRVLIWDNLGGNVRIARKQRVDVLDPATGLPAPDLTQNGQPVGWLTSDGKGRVTFTSTIPVARVVAPSGQYDDVPSRDLWGAAVGSVPFASSGEVSPTKAVRADDARLSDTRVPKTHAASHKSGSSDPILAADIGAETPIGSQAKATTALNDAKSYANTLAYGTNLAATDATVGSFFGSATATRAGADARYTRRGDLFISVTDPVYGAVGDGTTDDTAAINAAAAAALAQNRILFMPALTFKITDVVRFQCDVLASGATLNYFGTGEALVCGVDTASTVRKDMKLPKVNYGNSNNWDGTSVGVTLVNLDTCMVSVPYIQSFETNLLVIGRSRGCAYNVVTLGHISQGHRNIVLTQNASGWANQNTFIGGRLQHSNSRGAVKDDMAASMISLLKLAGASTSGPNNNTFVGTSIEGENWAHYRVTFDNARYNAFLNCRWEVNVDATSFIRSLNSSTDNRIEGGYDAWKVASECDSTSNIIIKDAQSGPTANLSSAQAIPHNVSTNVTSWATTGTTRCPYDPATGTFTPAPGRWLITAQVTFAANATGVRRLLLLINGSGLRRIVEVPAQAGKTTVSITETFKFGGSAVSFYFQAYQSSGADLALDTASGTTRISIEPLGG